MRHDYGFRYGQFKLEGKGYATIDLHKVTAVINDIVIMDNRLEIELSHEDATELEVILLGMDRSFQRAD